MQLCFLGWDMNPLMISQLVYCHYCEFEVFNFSPVIILENHELMCSYLNFDFMFADHVVSL